MNKATGLGVVACAALGLVLVSGCGTTPCGCPAAKGAYAGAAAATAPKHVLFIGFDGMAAWAFETSPTPYLHKLRDEWASTLGSRSVLPSSSAINWHSLFTCSASEQHGYNNWDSRKPVFPAAETMASGLYPDVFAVLRAQQPKATSGYFYQWEGMSQCVDTNACSVVKQAGGDIADQAIAYAKAERPKFLAIVWDAPDGAGHGKGWGSPDYMKCTAELDAQAKRVIDAYAEAGMLEDTVVMISSDHGGFGRGHGGPSGNEMNRPVILLGKNVKKGYAFAYPGAIYDEGATLAALLGIVDPPASWIGRPRNDAFVR